MHNYFSFSSAIVFFANWDFSCVPQIAVLFCLLPCSIFRQIAVCLFKHFRILPAKWQSFFSPSNYKLYFKVVSTFSRPQFAYLVHVHSHQNVLLGSFLVLWLSNLSYSLKLWVPLLPYICLSPSLSLRLFLLLSPLSSRIFSPFFSSGTPFMSVLWAPTVLNLATNKAVEKAMANSARKS